LRLAGYVGEAFLFWRFGLQLFSSYLFEGLTALRLT